MSSPDADLGSEFATAAVTPEEVRGALARLASMGVGFEHRRIALRVEPDPAGVAAVIAADRLADEVTVLHPGWTEHETARVLERFQPDLQVDGGWREAEADAPGAPVTLPDDRPTRWVLWSSGTSSGVPRGLVLSRSAFEASASAVSKRLDLGAEDRWLCTLSPAHVGGLALILRARGLGARLVAPGRFDGERVSSAIEAHDITHLSLVPTQLRLLLEERAGGPAPASLRAVLIGGAPMPPDLLDEALERGYPIALTWGMTEAASQLATATPERVRRKPGSVGPPLDGVELAIDPGPSETSGEIRVRSPTLADGTFNGPGRPPSPVTDADGWYHTGDLGWLDDDGDLHVAGRRSEWIISGGVNVCPAEVEASVRRHPAIRDAAVLGVPDPRWGERVVCVAVARDGAGSAPDLAELRRFVAATLAPPKRPRELRYMERLPRNANGKLDRPEIRRALWPE